ncbi:archaeal ATPase, fused to C-terminal DUF234 domain [Thermococcus chitonophagus]|uniref:Archaeal ATPase, fused to C-terminal DUF234 domain n=1 Tax=Thermococcus chitonophagus TaxID=54262 RepID=A0A160VSP9_9EURY|nr:archaeal ATPase, fused to C-terminal DUF234 domain [Thermococcus chitonophagus]
MISQFVDREKELKILEREWKNTPSFVVIYERRRIGKTRWLVEFSRDKYGARRSFDLRKFYLRKGLRALQRGSKSYI